MNTPPENTRNSILFPMEYPFHAMKFLSKKPYGCRENKITLLSLIPSD